MLEDGFHRKDQLLVDLGSADPFLQEQLRPDDLSVAAANNHQPLALFIHEGYDHSYFFVASVINRHLEHHAQALGLLS